MNVEKIKSFIVMDILERSLEIQKHGVEIIHLEIGEPDLPTPKKALDRVPEILSKYKMSYTPSLGITSLREAISEYYLKEYGVEVPVKNIVVVPGSSTGMALIISILLDKGGEFIITDPSYPCYPNFILHSGGEVVRINIYKDNNFLPEIDKLRDLVNQKTRGLIIASPSNPCGVLLPQKLVEEILEIGIPTIIDEIYQGIVFGIPKKESSAIKYFSADGNLIISNGFSKYFSMPGWRVGWLVVPDRYIPALQKLLQNIVISTPTLSQMLAEICMRECINELDEYVSIYKKRLETATNFLNNSGLELGYKVNGAFYIYLDLSNFINDSLEFSRKMLEEYSVALTPGLDFGTNRTNKFIRISLTNSEGNILTGLERLLNAIYDYNPSPRSI